MCAVETEDDCFHYTDMMCVCVCGIGAGIKAVFQHQTDTGGGRIGQY